MVFLGFLLHTTDFFGWHEFNKVFTKIEENKSDISMCPKLGRHLLIKKGSQDRHSDPKSIILFRNSAILEYQN